MAKKITFEKRCVYFQSSQVLEYRGAKDANPDRRPIRSDLECDRSGTGNEDETIHPECRVLAQAERTEPLRRDGRDLARRTQSRAESDGERFENDVPVR